MRRRLTATLAASALALSYALLGGTPAHASGNKVVWIMLENHSYSQIVGSGSAPFLNSLTTKGVLLTQSYAITHPSVPNYVGSTFGIPLRNLPATDCTNCKQNHSSIFDQGESWGAYQEGMASPCQMVETAAGYVPKHNPPTYSTPLINNGGCRAHDVPLTAMPISLPTYSFITPNLTHDMHDGTIAQGDAFMSSLLGTLMSRTDYTSSNLTIVVTFDEGSGGSKGENCAVTNSNDCHIATWFLNKNINANTRYNARVDHYDVLATTESLLGLPTLGGGTSFRSALGL